MHDLPETDGSGGGGGGGMWIDYGRIETAHIRLILALGRKEPRYEGGDDDEDEPDDDAPAILVVYVSMWHSVGMVGGNGRTRSPLSGLGRWEALRGG